jgi:hypothetical protein
MNVNDLKKAHARLPKRKKYFSGKDKSITPDTNPATYVLKFGKFKGEQLQNVPTQYLEWVVSNVNSRPDVVALVKRYLQKASKNPPAPKVARSAEGAKAVVGGGPSPSFIDQCSCWIYRLYQRAADIDVTQLSEEEFLVYQYWMDTARKMQTIIDQDGGKDSPEAQVALRALQALLVGHELKLNRSAVAGSCERGRASLNVCRAHTERADWERGSPILSSAWFDCMEFLSEI